MKVDVWNKEGMVLLTRDGGESLKISIPEFWEICRIGQRMDVRDEVENYLGNGGDFVGIDANVIRENAEFMDEVVEQVIDNRLSNENGDQIYEAICYCVKYGKNKDALVPGVVGKKLEDMEEEDFQDADRRREFGKLLREARVLRFELAALNYSSQGGDRNKADEIKLRLGDVVHSMDLLRVKEWLSQRSYDLDTGSPQYKEAMDMMEEICGWAFPELAAMVFDGKENDLIFREPHDSGLYVWAYYNPDSIAGGQIVENSFGAADSLRIAEAAVPAEIIDANHTYRSDVNRKEFFMTIFDMLKMKEDGYYLGDDIHDVCWEIVGEKPGVSQDDVKQRIFESFQEGRSTYELSGWDRGSVVVYCDCDLFTDRKVHFTTEESKFFYDMEREGQVPAYAHIAEKLAAYVMSGELQWSDEGARSAPYDCTWHGEVDVPYGFPGLDAIADCDSMELAASEMLRRLLRDGTGFRNVSVEQIGYYNNGIGFSFSFDTHLTADKVGSLVQKALDGLRFEACSDIKQASLGAVLSDAETRSNSINTASGKDCDYLKG